MVKYIKNRKPSRRELRKLWRNPRPTPPPVVQEDEPKTPTISIPPSPSASSPLRSSRVLPQPRKHGGRHRPISVPNSPSPQKKKRASPKLTPSMRKSDEDLQVDILQENGTPLLIQVVQDRLRRIAEECRDDHKKLEMLQEETEVTVTPHATPDWKRRQKLLQKQGVKAVTQPPPYASPRATRAAQQEQQSLPAPRSRTSDSVAAKVSSRSSHITGSLPPSKAPRTGVVQAPGSIARSREIAAPSRIHAYCRHPVDIIPDKTTIASKTPRSTVSTTQNVSTSKKIAPTPLLLPTVKQAGRTTFQSANMQNVKSGQRAAPPRVPPADLLQARPVSREPVEGERSGSAARYSSPKSPLDACQSGLSSATASRSTGQIPANRAAPVLYLTPAAVRRASPRIVLTQDKSNVTSGGLGSSSKSSNFPDVRSDAVGQIQSASRSQRPLRFTTTVDGKHANAETRPARVQPNVSAANVLSSSKCVCRSCSSTPRKSVTVSPVRARVSETTGVKKFVSKSNGNTFRSASTERVNGEANATSGFRQSKKSPSHIKSRSFRPVCPTAALVLLGSRASLVKPGYRVRAVTMRGNKAVGSLSSSCSRPLVKAPPAHTVPHGLNARVAPVPGPAFVPMPPLATRVPVRSVMKSPCLLEGNMADPYPMMRPEEYYRRPRLGGLSDVPRSLLTDSSDVGCVDVEAQSYTLDTLGPMIEVDKDVRVPWRALLTGRKLRVFLRVLGTAVLKPWRLAWMMFARAK